MFQTCRENQNTSYVFTKFSLEDLHFSFAFPALLARRIFGCVVKLYASYSASSTQSSLLTAITYHALRHVSQQLC